MHPLPPSSRGWSPDLGYHHPIQQRNSLKWRHIRMSDAKATWIFSMTHPQSSVCHHKPDHRRSPGPRRMGHAKASSSLAMQIEVMGFDCLAAMAAYKASHVCFHECLTGKVCEATLFEKKVHNCPVIIAHPILPRQIWGMEFSIWSMQRAGKHLILLQFCSGSQIY